MKNGTILFAFLFSSFNLFAQNEEQNYELDSFVFISKRTISSDKIQLSNKDFKKQAASFDDPSRLLMHYPGFSATGDQSNAISYHGLPTSLFSWQINGVDIVNPNHLANAGTSSDLGSNNAGGVNMMSGNIIDRYTFNTNHTTDKINGALGGVSDLKLGTPTRSFAQLSLLGAEAGLRKKWGNTIFYCNYRYSFTGLLGDLGVKFGDEDIRFQDLVGGIEHKTTKSSWKLDFAKGNSSNIHLPISNDDRPLAVQTIKDTLDIRYKADINIIATQYQYQVNEDSRWNIAAAYSQREDTRTMSGFVTLSNQNSYTVTDEYNNNEARLSGSIDYQMKDFNLGLRYTNYNLDYINITRFITTANSPKFSELIPYAKAEKTLFKALKAKAYIGALIGKQTKPIYNLNIEYPIGDLVISASQSQSHQNLGSYFSNSEDQPYISSNNTMLNIKYVKSSFNTSIQAFQYGIINAPTFTGAGNNNLFFTGLDGVDFNKKLTYNSSNKKYKTYGFTGQIEYHIPQFWINTNATLYDQDFQSESFYKYAVNFNIGKDILLRASKLSVSGSAHFRGAQQLFAIDLNKYYVDKIYNNAPQDVLKAYSRIDLRVVYNLKNSLWSLDIQNVTGQVNNNINTPSFNNSSALIGGLGTIPVLTWKRMF